MWFNVTSSQELPPPGFTSPTSRLNPRLCAPHPCLCLHGGHSVGPTHSSQSFSHTHPAPGTWPCCSHGRNPCVLSRIQMQGLLKFTFSTQHLLSHLAPKVFFLSTFGCYRRHRTILHRILQGWCDGRGAGAKAKATENQRHARKSLSNGAILGMNKNESNHRFLLQQ